MVDDEERERIYECAVMDARSGMTADLRHLIDYFNSEIHQLRVEIYHLAGRPLPGTNGQDRPQ